VHGVERREGGAIVERIRAGELSKHTGERVRIAGWLHRLRRMSRVSFLVLRDASGMAQVVLEDAPLVERVDALHAESVLCVEGMVTASEQAPGGFEVRDASIEVVSVSEEPPPFDLFRPVLKATLPTQLDHAAIALRHASRRRAWAIAAAAMQGFRATLDAEGFTEIATPKIVGAATEGGANVFRLDYFGRPAYLAQSPQFYKQMMVGVFERVYEVGPVFRAEAHDTTRHLNEYVSLDIEMGFIDDHRDVMAMLRRVIAGMLEAVRERVDGIELPEVPECVPSVHFTEALEMVWRETGEDARGEPDLSPAHERWLGAWAQREHGSDFVFVTGYPMSKRPFYTHPDPARPTHSNSFDLLFRGMELVTGGQRLHRYADYARVLAERGMDAAPLDGYLQAFRYGMAPHGGFAIGLERFVAQIIGAANVREVALFPRDMSRVEP
jgi:nondiscriminating aspartyl-tRNA synthetase